MQGVRNDLWKRHSKIGDGVTLALNRFTPGESGCFLLLICHKVMKVHERNARDAYRISLIGMVV
jgi:hypothetical protein